MLPERMACLTSEELQSITTLQRGTQTLNNFYQLIGLSCFPAGSRHVAPSINGHTSQDVMWHCSASCTTYLEDKPMKINLLPPLLISALVTPHLFFKPKSPAALW